MFFGFYASSRIFLVVLKFPQLQKSKKLWPSENHEKKVEIFSETEFHSKFSKFPKIMYFLEHHLIYLEIPMQDVDLVVACKMSISCHFLANNFW